MGYRRRIYFTEKQKAETWDRWQRGESMRSMVGFLTEGHLRSTRCWPGQEVFAHQNASVPAWC